MQVVQVTAEIDLAVLSVLVKLLWHSWINYAGHDNWKCPSFSFQLNWVWSVYNQILIAFDMSLYVAEK